MRWACVAKRLCAQHSRSVAQLGFGYRAPYVMSAVEHLLGRGGTAFLDGLRLRSLDECRAEVGGCSVCPRGGRVDPPAAHADQRDRLEVRRRRRFEEGWL